MITLTDRVIPYLDTNDYTVIENDLVLKTGIILQDDFLYRLAVSNDIDTYQQLAEVALCTLDPQNEVPADVEGETLGYDTRDNETHDPDLVTPEQRILNAIEKHEVEQEGIREDGDIPEVFAKRCGESGWDILEYSGNKYPVVIQHPEHGRFKIPKAINLSTSLRVNPEYVPKEEYRI